MTSLLSLRSSILGDAGVSNQLVDATLAALRDQRPELGITERNLGTAPIPHFGTDAVAAMGGDPRNPAQADALALSDQLIAELKASDVLLIGAPLYNFGIASSLKSWFDHVMRAGETFSYSEAGPKGLLTGKRSIIVTTRGGSYAEGAAREMDSVVPHLRTMLNFIGITDQSFVVVDRLAFGPEAKAASVAAAQVALAGLLGLRLNEAA
ncbi:NAD(P)H-dependent oxidoreductase [Fertoebacter nigrum]|uniref:FMN dependent NADH:quinone oxidoreductase n=1 Tax=Fertoeibacter niger TaxID=2656921 RepID=A0A8X8KS18_9RHOB|nr:NAD(P)H-dependent oxidoreductase [Fertoeibacter niger]NUB45907.1 NAD(P)H-dependent oxidoreductase [Fertoeibacter niger]